MNINNKQINTPTFELITEIRRQINLKGIPKLNRILNKGDFAMITCPNDDHKNGQERNPSCTVLLQDRGNLKEGFVRCFACGYKASFPQFISTCFNVEDNGEFGEQWLEDNSNFSLLDGLNNFKFKEFTLNKKEEVEEVTYVSEEELESYRFYHPYMWERKLTPEVVDKFDIGYDKENEMLTFPVYDNEGRCLFVVKRSVNYKHFVIPEKITKDIFGMNHITPDIKKVIVCESVINALTCWTHGKPAIALFGTGTQHQINVLKKSDITHYVLAFDGDISGKRAFEKFKKALNNKIITTYRLPEGKDINDLTWEEFEALEEKFSLEGKF